MDLIVIIIILIIIFIEDAKNWLILKVEKWPLFAIFGTIYSNISRYVFPLNRLWCRLLHFFCFSSSILDHLELIFFSICGTSIILNLHQKREAEKFKYCYENCYSIVKGFDLLTFLRPLNQSLSSDSRNSR